MSHISYLLLVFSLHFLVFSVASKDNQISKLNKLIKSKSSSLNNRLQEEQWTEEYISNLSPIHIVPQEGSMKTDQIDKLQGQPEVDFNHYAGYVTVDATAGRSLFYYFAESPQNHASKPLVLWLNGGPGCSSFGYGAMEELGPFRVNSDGKTLYHNDYAWNKVANVLFLESPAGVGFSYSNTSSDYRTGDTRIAKDSYTFLLNWLQRFPQYKTRDFFIAGESYAGHYVPQLASLICSENKKTKTQLIINLRGMIIGNAWIDDSTSLQGMYDYYWTHALNSDETHDRINKYCDYDSGNFSGTCEQYRIKGDSEFGSIDIYNIYAPSCDTSARSGQSGSVGSLKNLDPCSDEYVETYLNIKEVQEALHARKTSWSHCGGIQMKDSPSSTLPVINQLITNGISVWIYSGDVDGRVPVTSSRYSVNKLKLPIETAWRAWYNNKEVGGYVVGYKGLVLTTVRGAGHMVPGDQPERALVMISSFLQGKLPPPQTE